MDEKMKEVQRNVKYSFSMCTDQRIYELAQGQIVSELLNVFN